MIYLDDIIVCHCHGTKSSLTKISINRTSIKFQKANFFSQLATKPAIFNQPNSVLLTQGGLGITSYLAR